MQLSVVGLGRSVCVLIRRVYTLSRKNMGCSSDEQTLILVVRRRPALWGERRLHVHIERCFPPSCLASWSRAR